MAEDQEKPEGGWGAFTAFSSGRDGHGDSNRSFWSFTLFFILLALVGIGYYTYYQASGATFFGKTVSNNVDLETGLVAHWTFDGDQMDWASTTGEVMNRGTTGVRGDATSFTSSAASPGKIGQAVTFDGADDYVNVPYQNLNFERTDAFSISVWAKFDDFAAPGSAQALIGNFNPAPDNGMYLIWCKDAIAGICAKGSVGLEMAVDVKIEDEIRVHTGTDTFMPNMWTLITFTYDGSSSASGAKIYKNGVLQSQTVVYDGLSSGTIKSNRDWRIGEDYTGDWFKGQMDDMRIYSRALTAAEVEALYNVGEGSKIQITDTPANLETGLVGHFTFDGDQMDWASTTGEVENSGSATVRGNVTNFTSTAATIGKIGQALSFAGTDDYIETATTPFDFERTEPFSISTWYENSGVAGGSARSLAGNANNGLDSRGWLFGLKAGGLCGTNAYLGFYLANTTSNGITVCTANPVALSGWHHAVVTYDGSSSASGVKIYVDGVSQSLTTPKDNLSATTLSTLKMRIGDDQTADFWQGKIDDVRVYNRTLSAEEVEQLYLIGTGSTIN